MRAQFVTYFVGYLPGLPRIIIYRLSINDIDLREICKQASNRAAAQASLLSCFDRLSHPFSCFLFILVYISIADQAYLLCK